MSRGLTSHQRAALHGLSLGPVFGSAKHPQYVALERRCLATREVMSSTVMIVRWTITHAGRQALQAGQ